MHMQNIRICDLNQNIRLYNNETAAYSLFSGVL